MAREKITRALLCAALTVISSLALEPQAALAQASPFEAVREATENLSGEQSGEQTEGLRALAARGARVEEILSLDALPRGGWAAELAISFQGMSARYPVKLARTQGACEQWRVVWAPSAEFSTAMLNVLASGQLPTTAASPEWHSALRLPALPILLTRDRIFTPYGSMLAAPEPSPSALSPARPQRSAISPPPALLKHTQRWLDSFLEGDEGAAAVDVIADGRASWRDLTRVVFGVSSVGFYKLYLIARQGERLAAIETAAPVFGSLPGVQEPVPLVLAYAPLSMRAGFRVSQGSVILEEPDTCDPGVSFCADASAELSERLKSIAQRMRAKNPKNPAYAMFATTGEVTLASALPWLEVTGAGLGIAQRRVFIGYIAREGEQ